MRPLKRWTEHQCLIRRIQKRRQPPALAQRCSRLWPPVRQPCHRARPADRKAGSHQQPLTAASRDRPVPRSSAPSLVAYRCRGTSSLDVGREFSEAELKRARSLRSFRASVISHTPAYSGCDCCGSRPSGAVSLSVVAGDGAEDGAGVGELALTSDAGRAGCCNAEGIGDDAGEMALAAAG